MYVNNNNLFDVDMIYAALAALVAFDPGIYIFFRRRFNPTPRIGESFLPTIFSFFLEGGGIFLRGTFFILFPPQGGGLT